MSTDTTQSTPLSSSPNAALMFPKLSPAQIARVASHGVIRPIDRGDVLIEEGQTNVPFFVVRAGEIEVVRPSSLGDLVIAVTRPGQFTGEVSMLLGRPAMMRILAREPGEVVQLTRDQMHALIQTDAELSEVLMSALMYRRLALVAQGLGDAILIGSLHSAATLRIREFLTRNGHPFKYLDLDRDADVRDLLARFHVGPAEIPVLICRGDVILRNPSNEAIADHLGFNGRIDQAQLRDVVIVGAGPAGLAAAVYAASEGLDALVIEARSPGGQAASSSRIENYLGFPTGISGQDLAGRAYAQAQKFGAEVMIAKGRRSDTDMKFLRNSAALPVPPVTECFVRREEVGGAEPPEVSRGLREHDPGGMPRCQLRRSRSRCPAQRKPLESASGSSWTRGAARRNPLLTWSSSNASCTRCLRRPRRKQWPTSSRAWTWICQSSRSMASGIGGCCAASRRT